MNLKQVICNKENNKRRCHLYSPRTSALSFRARFPPVFSPHPSPNGASPQNLLLTWGVKDWESPVLAVVSNPEQAPIRSKLKRYTRLKHCTQLPAAWKVQQIHLLKSFTSPASLLHIRESLYLIKSNNINLVPFSFSNQLSSVQPVWWILVSSKNIIWHQRERIKKVQSGNPSGQLCWTAATSSSCTWHTRGYLQPHHLPHASAAKSPIGMDKRQKSAKNLLCFKRGATRRFLPLGFRSTLLTPGVHLAV